MASAGKVSSWAAHDSDSEGEDIPKPGHNKHQEHQPSQAAHAPSTQKREEKHGNENKFHESQPRRQINPDGPFIVNLY